MFARNSYFPELNIISNIKAIWATAIKFTGVNEQIEGKNINLKLMYEIDDVKGHDYLRPKNPFARDNSQ